MKISKLLAILTLGLMTLTLTVSCGKKKKNDDNNVVNNNPNHNPNRNRNRTNHPGYPDYDIANKPVVIRIHNFADGKSRIECLNYQNQEVDCGDVMRFAGVQPNPYLPYQEISVDGFGYGQQYQDQYAGWSNNPYQQYPQYPGGTVYPEQSGFYFNANVNGYY